MVFKRMMPCLLYNGSGLVKTVNFKNPSYIGDPINAIKIYNDKEVDELVLIDINATAENREPKFDEIEKFASECFMPFSYGGGVKTFDHFKRLFSLGVEKVIVNTLLFTDPEVVKQAIELYGAQSIVASIDYKKNLLGFRKVHSYSNQNTSMSLKDFIAYAENEIGVGELLLTSVDQEGTWKGYDSKFMKEVGEFSALPLVALGGAGSVDDLQQVLYEANCNACGIGSMAIYQKKGMGVLINFPKRHDVIKKRS